MKKYRICDLVVQMQPLYEPLKTQIKAYLTDQDAEVDFVIPNIDDKVKEHFEEVGYENIGLAEYMLYGAYFYTRLVMYDGIMLHSSAVVYEDKAYLFSAPSGTGKSTHTGLWTEVFESAYILNDDKPAIRITDNKIYAYGTPFSGKTDLNVNEKKQIQGICFIEQDKNNWIEKASAKESISNMYRETVRSPDKDLLNRTFNIVDEVLKNIPIYKMGLTISHEAVLLAYETMKGNIE